MTLYSHREASDALFDASPRAMAARFGGRAIERMRAGRDPYEAARLAGHFAAQVIREIELLQLRVLRFPTPPYGGA